jgi:hypothetical protein
MRRELSKDAALLRDIERRFGKTLTKNDRIRLHRLILKVETPKTPGPNWGERAKAWLATIAKIGLALGLKKLLDHLDWQF